MLEPIEYTTHRLRNQKEFSSTNTAKVVLDNFDTAAVLHHRQQQQLKHKNSGKDQPILRSTPPEKWNPPKAPSLTPLIQLAKPPLCLPFSRPTKLPTPVGRRSEHLVEQHKTGTTLKGCAVKRIARTLQDKNKHITINQDLSSNLQDRKDSGWTGKKLEQDGRTYTLDEVLKLPGMQLIKWDGKETLLIQDTKTRNVITLLEIPNGSSWTEDCQNFFQLLDWAEDQMRQFKANPRKEEIWAKVYAHPFYQRVLRYAQHGMKSYHPKLERLYSNVKQMIRVDNPSLADPLPGCCFSACNLNLGRAVTLRHTDFLNLLFGQCAVLALGEFDYRKGGHLVLWDLGLVIKFPPGSMILLPSALVEHSNVSIAADERRSSITFYSASGLFRWVTNGFMSDKEFKARAGVKMRQRWDQHRANLWKVGLELLSNK
ncbi:hypothetical protein AAF712_009439 [Marasmius tenuissimus]|uniref:Uncharacterized protein n=1 Tax=Marasmius tenuissimus TaxID=585030 RepID=A0ABR2ZPY0_9AGAR